MIDEDEGIDKERALELVREKLEIRNELNDQFGLGSLKLIEAEDDAQADEPASMERMGWKEGDMEEVEEELE